jgi:hypothetical protein
MTTHGMTVRELAAWLATFEDQDAVVECYNADGERICINPEDINYVDFRNNPFVAVDADWKNGRYLRFDW